MQIVCVEFWYANDVLDSRIDKALVQTKQLTCAPLFVHCIRQKHIHIYIYVSVTNSIQFIVLHTFFFFTLSRTHDDRGNRAANDISSTIDNNRYKFQLKNNFGPIFFSLPFSLIRYLTDSIVARTCVSI